VKKEEKEAPLNFHYDPKTMQKILRAKDWMARSCESWECASDGVEAALEGLVAHLSD